MGGIIMQQFNLQKYLTNPSLKVVTRDRKPVRIICTNAIGNYPVIGLILCNDGREYADSFKENGRWTNATERDRDLFFLEQEYVDSPFVTKNNEKFDPNTLKPFDQVLVRDDIAAKWACTFYSHIYEEKVAYPYYTTSGVFAYCIPYNSDTKNLVGTKEEAPKYYRYWE